MSLFNNAAEIQRLCRAFEVEASKFHDVRLNSLFVSQSGASFDREFVQPNHAIMLWQYYGAVGSADGDQLVANLRDSDFKWGLRGAQLSRFAVIEGPATDLFVRMAQRAGSLFDPDEATTINARVVDEILERERVENPTAKPTAVTNNNPLAIWLNYLLYHLSRTHPGREKAEKIEPDPFALSLLALERLAEELTPGKSDRSSRDVAEIMFQVALSFPGEKRTYVADVAQSLRYTLGEDAIFYDHNYQAQLARPNLDTLLQDVYRNRSELLVVFLCEDYSKKEWCGLEWRAIRDIIKARQDQRIMFVRFDDSPVDGVLSIDGYLDARSLSSKEISLHIVERLHTLRKDK